MRRIFAAVVAVGTALAIAPAFAEGASDAAAAWGLLGVWSLDCAKAASRETPRLSFVRIGGKLAHRRDFGDVKDEFPVLAAQRRSDGSLEVMLDLASFGERRTVVFAKAGDQKKRAVANWSDKGEYSIRDGKFVANGAPTPVQTRCVALTN
jgi:hypothetical protein